MKATLIIEMEGDQLEILTTYDPPISELPQDKVLPLPHLLIQQIFADLSNFPTEKETEK